MPSDSGDEHVSGAQSDPLMKKLLRSARIFFALALALAGVGRPGSTLAGPVMVGPEFGAAPIVNYFSVPGQAPTRTFYAFRSDFLGGVRVAYVE